VQFQIRLFSIFGRNPFAWAENNSAWRKNAKGAGYAAFGRVPRGIDCLPAIAGDVNRSNSPLQAANGGLSDRVPIGKDYMPASVGDGNRYNPLRKAAMRPRGYAARCAQVRGQIHSSFSNYPEK
jgi:hypothetical protein